MPNPDGTPTIAESQAMLAEVQTALAKLDTLRAQLIRTLPPAPPRLAPLSIEERLQALELVAGFRASAEDVVTLPHTPENIAGASGPAPATPRAVVVPDKVEAPPAPAPAPTAP